MIVQSLKQAKEKQKAIQVTFLKVFQNSPLTYVYYGKEQFLSLMDSSINKLITSTPLPKVDGSAFAEACF